MNNDIKSYNPGMVDQVIDNRDPDYGGVWSILSGVPGSGKTNAMIRISKRALQEYDDRIIWRGTPDCEWMRFIQAQSGSVPVKVWLHQNVTVKSLVNRTEQERVELEDVVADVETFYSYQNLVDQLQDTGGQVNVIYLRPFHDHKSKAGNQWLSFFRALVARPWPENITFNFDEIEDLFPLNDSRMTTICANGADILKAMRKNDIHGLTSTHQETQVDWRVLTKIPYSIYFQRAKVKSDRAPQALDFDEVNNLDKGSAYIVGEQYEKTRFKFEGVPDRYKLQLAYNT